MDNDGYRKIAHHIKRGEFGDIRILLRNECVFSGHWEGEVVSKERPRSGKGGHMFTPKKTRDFEKTISEWLDKEYKGRPVYFPVQVSLWIYDEYTLSPHDGGWEGRCQWIGLTSMQHGDIDNKAKAVLDAANGILYRDDKQINGLILGRNYATTRGFRITVNRNGLSKHELTQLRKFI